MKNMRFLFSLSIITLLVAGIVLFLRHDSLLVVSLFFAGAVFGFLAPCCIDAFFTASARAKNHGQKMHFTNVVAQGVHGACRLHQFHEDVPVSGLRSYPILVAYLLSFFFLTTSSLSFFARGFFISFGSFLFCDLYISSGSESLLQSRWFSQFPTRLNTVEMKLFLAVLYCFFFIFIITGIFFFS